MKIICLVPSITETLLACDIKLVGRSRFCIHPANAVEQIPKVGGTKDIDWHKTAGLKPDLVILDKEENTLEMAESCPYEYIALHINSVNDVGSELAKLAERIDNAKLMAIANRWQSVSQQNRPQKNLTEIPGIKTWWNPVTRQTQLVYLIWRDPWMAIGNNTFIQSVLDFCGLEPHRIAFDEKYPEVDLADYSPEETVLLFSSEPYPFDRYQDELMELGFACALIDGEKYSWYGVRSLEFLESIVGARF